MEIFINELSLHGQFGDIAELEAAIDDFNKVFAVTTQAKHIFSSSYLVNYEAIRDSIMAVNINRINRDEREKFKRIIFNQALDWRDIDHRKHSNDDLFYCKIIDDIVTDCTLAEAAERQLIDTVSETNRLIVNFTQSHFKESISIIKNDISSVFLPCIDDDISFKKWLSLNETVEKAEDYLKSTLLFSKTKHQVQGRTIYQHTKNGQYWYLDNFHKTHFEVFNALQEHLGVANLQGEIDYAKKEKGRTINV
jgi:hypothetical protein